MQNDRSGEDRILHLANSERRVIFNRGKKEDRDDKRNLQEEISERLPGVRQRIDRPAAGNQASPLWSVRSRPYCEPSRKLRIVSGLQGEDACSGPRRRG